jgi:hypothetical protein
MTTRLPQLKPNRQGSLKKKKKNRHRKQEYINHIPYLKCIEFFKTAYYARSNYL